VRPLRQFPARDPEAWLAERLVKAETHTNDQQQDDPPPSVIDGNWWLARDLPRPVAVLGEVICDSTRMFLGGPTGIGKTHLAMAMAGAIATGRGFLHWLGPARPLAVLYIDGEMARDLMQDRDAQVDEVALRRVLAVLRG
jgi:RecA-family ATPase